MSAENGLCDFFDSRFYIFSYSCTCDEIFVGSVTSCMSSILAANSALVYEPKCMGMGGRGVAGAQPISTDGAHINFGDLTPHLTYGTRDKERSLLSLELQTLSKSFRHNTLPRVM